MRDRIYHRISIIIGVSLGLLIALAIPTPDDFLKNMPIESAADTSLITFTAKPSDKLLIAVWDSELNAYRSFTARADSVANGLGTRLIHKEDKP